MKRGLVLALALVLVSAGAFAQTRSGNIYGTVTDASGAVLPGVSVTLNSDLGNRSTVTGGQGEFRFLNLDKGRYKLNVGLTGFTTVNREVIVTTGDNVELNFSLKVATVEESVTVTAETPLVDTKRRGTSTTMTTEELQDVPNARDPWGVLKNVPGVLVDRVNIAGNENGQQAAVAGKGSTSADKMWNIDGLVVTDMSATGASPTYFDFGAFQEINVTTGGNDLNVQTGGIGINLVTKRGTNAFHGGGRFIIAHDKVQSSNVPDEVVGDARLKGGDKANHIDQVTDYGFDLGGPIVKDKLWFYGTYGKQDIRLRTFTQTADKTLLPSYNGKLNWQAASDTMVSAFYFLGNKKKFGRLAGLAITETQPFTYDQANAGTEGGLPEGLWKLEINHTFSPNFFMSAKAAYYDTGFGLIAEGGEAQSYTLDYVAAEAIGSNSTYLAIRPQTAANIDGNYFFQGMGGNNEMKFGFGYRKTTTNSVSRYNAGGLVGVINAAGPGGQIAKVYRDGITNYGGKYFSAYLGDVFTKNRFTLNLGLRFDKQTAQNLASDAPANATFGTLLPALSYTGSENIYDLSDISPRVGMSFALDESRKTVLRASYARYASQLSYGNVTNENPVATGYLAYGWNDLNGDRFVQAGEVDLNDFQYSSNVDPANPSAVGSTVNKIDRDVKNKHDHEVVLGIDREVGANFAVGLAYTWRRTTDWEYRPRIGGACADAPTLSTCTLIGPESYSQNAASTQRGFTAFTYSPNATLVTAGLSGRLRTNRPDYSTTFGGLEGTLTKRLANKWMARVAFSYNNWVENFDGTPVGANLNGGNPTRTETDPLVDGGQVASLSGGSGKASFYTSTKWQIYGNALVQLPWSFDLSGAVFGRQGGPFPKSLRLSAGRDATISALAMPEVDTDRYDNVWDIDLRLAKNIKFGGAALTLSAELFNVLNNNLVLSRARYATSATLNRVEEVISPRIARFGVRFTF